MSPTKKEIRRRKREEARRARLEAERRRRRRRQIRNLAILAVVVVAAVVGGFFWFQQRQESAAAINQARQEAGCSDIESHPEEGRNHVGPTETVEYETNPPSSGNHRGATAAWGVYRQRVDDESMVHNLEHGGVIVHYRPDDLTEDEIEELEELVEGYQGPELGVILNPNPDIPTPVAMASWQHTQTCEELSILAVKGFIEDRCEKGPEKFPLGC